jgi:membrane-bound inhibitor of C-type lysozyme
MDFIYIVVDCGEAFQTAFTTYKSALNAVKLKYKEELERQLEEEIEYNCSPVSDIDVVENENGATSLYIEKQIYIVIYKLSINTQ